MKTATMIHPFEAAGLGKAPFQYVGMEHQEMSYGLKVAGSVGGCQILTKPGGTCAYCGQYITAMFNVESADGQRFHVGCDCIKKVGDAKIVKAMKKDQKKAKDAREKARILAAKDALSETLELHSKPHPNQFQAAEGKTLWHYCEWLFSHAGRTGQLRAAAMIEKAAKAK